MAEREDLRAAVALLEAEGGEVYWCARTTIQTSGSPFLIEAFFRAGEPMRVHVGYAADRAGESGYTYVIEPQASTHAAQDLLRELNDFIANPSR